MQTGNLRFISMQKNSNECAIKESDSFDIETVNGVSTINIINEQDNAVTWVAQWFSLSGMKPLLLKQTQVNEKRAPRWHKE